MKIRIFALVLATTFAAGSAHAQSGVQMIAEWGVVEGDLGCALAKIEGDETLKFMHIRGTDVLMLNSPTIARTPVDDTTWVVGLAFDGKEPSFGLGTMTEGSPRTLGFVANPEEWLKSFRTARTVRISMKPLSQASDAAPMMTIDIPPGSGAAFDAYLACRARKKK